MLTELQRTVTAKAASEATQLDSQRAPLRRAPLEQNVLNMLPALKYEGPTSFIRD